MNKKVALIILDGWGIARDKNVSAIDKANTPFIDSLYQKYPHTQLSASGSSVGLPEGQMGNSEVGHLNIGSGRIVDQDLVRIDKTIHDKSFFLHPMLKKIVKKVNEKNKTIHLIGLLSKGGVHSHLDHLKALCDFFNAQQAKKVYIHAFTDGRDTDPKSGISNISDIQSMISKTSIQLASVVGRYYAMDRDKRWERVKLAYDLLVHGKGEQSRNVLESIQKKYDEGITDEFMKPIVMVDEYQQPLTSIQNGDTVIFFNFRSDRGRQLTEVLSQKDHPDRDMYKKNLDYYTMTPYDISFNNVQILFEKENINNTLGEILANHNKKQLRIAETEKYPHVTFFFSGGREEMFNQEERVLCPSPKVATYDLKPEMSAYEITEAVTQKILSKNFDFICLNFANTDMVGHTGDFQAAVKACETVDSCLEKVTMSALENGYTLLVTADHGNADCMVNADGSPNTSHTTQPVPLILVTPDDQDYLLKAGRLCDIAPTILDLMNINKPKEMTGTSLIIKE